MSDKPMCGKCGKERTVMKSKRGVWYLGCADCGGKKPPADPEPKPKEKPKEKEKKESWLDGIL